MNAIVRALGVGTRLQPRTARLSVPFGSAARPTAPLPTISPFEMTTRRALQRTRN